MQIFKGTVQAYKPSSNPDNKMWVVLDGKDFEIEVIYTSPAYQRHYYGVYSKPPVTSEVLVAYDGRKYYYLSTIVDYHENLETRSKNTAGQDLPLFSDRMMSNPSGVPTTMMFKNDLGAGLDIKDFRGKNAITNQPEPIVSHVELQSANGHKLLLGASPEMNCVMLQTKDKDGIVIGGPVPIGSLGKPGIPYAKGQITITSLYDHLCTVKKGSYKLKIKDGRDITIENNSRGTFNIFQQDPTQFQGPGAKPSLQFGNLNLISKFRDINIYTDNPVPGVMPPPGFSNIYISTSNGTIQIKSGGDVVILSNGNTTVQSVGDLNLVSQTGNVNIQAALNVTTQALGGNTDIQSSQDTNIVGFGSTNLGSGSAPVTLNSVAQVPVVPLEPTVPLFNVYGR